MTEQRPSLTPQLSRAEFERWYWLREELARAARTMGLPASGGKRHLAAVIAAHLDGAPLPPQPARPRLSNQLEPPFTLETAIPAGQRSTQALRAFFEAHIGHGFRFDGEMRGFLAAGGETLGAAIEHWHSTRGAGPREIDEQFELNRFSRQWHAAHPGQPREKMIRAWKAHRASPVDAR